MKMDFRLDADGSYLPIGKNHAYGILKDKEVQE